MKAVCYLRVGKSRAGFVFDATAKPSAAPLKSGGPPREVPTKQLKLRLELPDNLFDGCDAVVDIKVPPEVAQTVVSARVEEPKG